VHCRAESEYQAYDQLHCAACGGEWLEFVYQGLSPHDLVTQEDTLRGRASMWRYRNFLPIVDPANIVSMGEGATPLLETSLGRQLGLPRFLIKDERGSATGSFKDRSGSLCISKCREFGVEEFVLSSTGNVAAAFGAYAARAGVRLWIFIPERVNRTKLTEVIVYGHNVIEVAGTYDQAAVVARRFANQRHIPLDVGVRNPLRWEAMKTLAYEIAEDLNWDVPDWYVQAVSGGIGPLGVWKGFRELYDLGLTRKMPKIACIQAAGCAPMAQAFELDSDEIIAVDPATEITTLSTGRPAGYPLIYRVVKESGGYIGSVGDPEAFAAQELLAQSEGIFAESAAAVAVAGLIKMVKSGLIKGDETAVCVCSGEGLRDIEFVYRHMTRGIAGTVAADCQDFSALRSPDGHGPHRE
jgi:threonine synthase